MCSNEQQFWPGRLVWGLTVFIVGKRKALYAVAMMSPYKPLTLLLYMAEGPRLPTIGPME